MKKNQNKKLMQFERYFRKNHILSIMAYLITIMKTKKERLRVLLGESGPNAP